jgi:hypothetical protein
MPLPSRRPGPPTAHGTLGPRNRTGCLARPRSLGRYSCRPQVGFKSLDRDLNRGVGLLAPQFAPGEDHRIEPLRVLARPQRGGIRKHMASAHGLDRAELAAGIARQARAWGDSGSLQAASRGVAETADQTRRAVVPHVGGLEQMDRESLILPASRPYAGRRNKWFRTRRGSSKPSSIRQQPSGGRCSNKYYRSLACGLRQVRPPRGPSRL